MELPKIAKSALSIVLPVHNVAERLAKLLEEWTTYLARLKRDYEIILVDDGSSDGTAEAADGIAAVKPKVRVLRHSERRGFGACLRTGIAEARNPLLCYAGADPSYRPADLGKLLGRLHRVHLVSGYRAGHPVPGG